MNVWSKVKEGRAGIVLSLCFSFLVMIYAPLEMFFIIQMIFGLILPRYFRSVSHCFFFYG